MSAFSLLLAGLAVSLLIEGVLFIAAPGRMRDALKALSEQSERELVIAGAISAAIGSALLAFLIHTA